MVWFSKEKLEITDKLDINKYREDLINLYHKYFIYLNGYDKMDAFLKVTETEIDKYLDKNIYEYAENYKSAVKFVNSLNNKDKYLCIYKNDSLVGIVRFKETKTYIRIYELISNSKMYDKVLKYFETNYQVKKIYLEIPINDIKLLVLSSKMGYLEDNKDMDDNKKYIVNKEL